MSGPRQSVSAEVYGFYNPKKAFQAKIIPKTKTQKETLQNLLKKIFMFKFLEQEELNIVIDAMEEKIFGAGQQVITQGDDGSELYVIFQGQLDCTKVFSGQSEETLLKKYEAGEVFGELCLLYNTPRAASIKCTSDCVLFSLDRETFNHIGKVH
jgi:cAMP-dependent protein kinase regulator